MLATKIAAVIEEMAPLELALPGEESGFIAGEPEREVSVIGVSWRATAPVLREALKSGVEMLVIHEPLFQSEKAFLVDASKLNWTPNRERRALVERGGFAVYRAHSNLDDAEPGQSSELASRLGLTVTGTLPYGRIGSVERMPLARFAEIVKGRLGCPRVLVVGDLDEEIASVAAVAGGGNALADMLELAKLGGADVMVSGDIQDSRARYASELRLAIIDAGGYYTETPGMHAFAERLGRRISNARVLWFDSGPAWSIL